MLCRLFSVWRTGREGEGVGERLLSDPLPLVFPSGRTSREGQRWDPSAGVSVVERVCLLASVGKFGRMTVAADVCPVSTVFVDVKCWCRVDGLVSYVVRFASVSCCC